MMRSAVVAGIGRRGTLAGLAAAPLILSGRRGRAVDPKRLIGVIEEDPPFFNPAVSSGISSFVAGSPCYSALTRMNADGKVSKEIQHAAGSGSKIKEM